MKRKMVTILATVMAAGMVMTGCGSSAGTKENKSVLESNGKNEQKDEALLKAEEIFEEIFLDWMENNWKSGNEDGLNAVMKVLNDIKSNEVEMEDGIIEGNFGVLISGEEFLMNEAVEKMVYSATSDELEAEEILSSLNIDEYVEENVNVSSIYNSYLDKYTNELEEKYKVTFDKELSSVTFLQYFMPLSDDGNGMFKMIGTSNFDKIQDIKCPQDYGYGGKAGILISGRIDTNNKTVEIHAKYIDTQAESAKLYDEAKAAYNLAGFKQADKLNLNMIQHEIENIITDNDMQISSGIIYIIHNDDKSIEVKGATGIEDLVKEKMDPFKCYSRVDRDKNVVKIELNSESGKMEVNSIDYVTEAEVK